MAKYIVQHRRGTSQQWASEETIIPMEGEIVIEIDEENSLHKLKIGDGVHTYSELAYLMAGDEVITQVLAKALPRVVSVTLDVDKWTKTTCATNPNLGYYSQSVAIEGITKYSRLDLQPDADMLAEFQQLNLAFVTENKNGVITVYSVGDMPLKTYTIQATLVETECDLDYEKIVGIPVGKPTTIIDDTSDTSETTTWSASHIADVASGRITSVQNVDKQVIVIDDVSSVKHKISVNIERKDTSVTDDTEITLSVTGRNLISYPYDGTTIPAGITFTDNGDGSITINGKNDGSRNSVFYFSLNKSTTLPVGTYCTLARSSGFQLQGLTVDDKYVNMSDVFTLDANQTFKAIYLVIPTSNTTTFNNFTIHPMLAVGNTVSPEYERYNGFTITTTLGDMPVDVEAISPTVTIMVDLPNLMFKEIKYLKELSISYPEATENMPGFMSIDDKAALHTIAENYAATGGFKNRAWVTLGYDSDVEFNEEEFPMLGDTWICMNDGAFTKKVLLVDPTSSFIVRNKSHSKLGDVADIGRVGKYKINLLDIGNEFSDNWNYGRLAVLNSTGIVDPLLATGANLSTYDIYTDDDYVMKKDFIAVYTTKFYEI